MIRVHLVTEKRSFAVTTLHNPLFKAECQGFLVTILHNSLFFSRVYPLRSLQILSASMGSSVWTVP